MIRAKDSSNEQKNNLMNIVQMKKNMFQMSKKIFQINKK